MLDQVEIGGLRRGRRWTISSAPSGAGLRGLSITVAEAGDAGELVLVPGLVALSAAGVRIWRGALANTSASPCRDVLVRLGFLDAQGRRVADLGARSGRLDAGDELPLETRLPSAAVDLRVEVIRWRTPDALVDLGPLRPQRLRTLAALGA